MCVFPYNPIMAKTLFHIDPEWLKDQYLTQNKNMREIADLIKPGFSTTTVWNNIKKHGLRKPKSQRASRANRTRFEKGLAFSIDGLSLKQLGEKFNFDLDSLRTFTGKNPNCTLIDIQKHVENYKPRVAPMIDASELFKQYVTLNRPLEAIGKDFGISRSSVTRQLRNLGITKDGYKLTLDPKWLEDQYIALNKSQREISNSLDSRYTITVINNILMRHGIQKSPELHHLKIKETKIKTGSVFTIEGVEIKTLMKKFNLSKGTVKAYLTKNPKCSLKDLEVMLKLSENSFTNIEQVIRTELGLEKFNKKPKDLQIFRKPDFKITDQLYLNTDGLYWHSEHCQTDNKYHLALREGFERSGLRILQFRADEIDFKLPIVKSIVNNLLGKSTKVFARKTRIMPVSSEDAKIFLDRNHLMGPTNAKHFGLYLDSKLVSLISYKEFKDYVKIERFCSGIGLNVIGGFSKLLKCVPNPNSKEIYYWVDLRYGTGNYLKTLGFSEIRTTLGWKWTNLTSTFNRLTCKANMDSRRLTEAQHAKEMKLCKIYDAGQRLFIRK